MLDTTTLTAVEADLHYARLVHAGDADVLEQCAVGLSGLGSLNDDGFAAQQQVGEGCGLAIRSWDQSGT